MDRKDHRAEEVDLGQHTVMAPAVGLVLSSAPRGSVPFLGLIRVLLQSFEAVAAAGGFALARRRFMGRHHKCREFLLGLHLQNERIVLTLALVLH